MLPYSSKLDEFESLRDPNLLGRGSNQSCDLLMMWMDMRLIDDFTGSDEAIKPRKWAVHTLETLVG